MGEDIQSILNFSADPFLKALESCRQAVVAFYKTLGDNSKNASPFDRLGESAGAAADQIKSFGETVHQALKTIAASGAGQASPFDPLVVQGEKSVELIKAQAEEISRASQSVSQKRGEVKSPLEHDATADAKAVEEIKQHAETASKASQSIGEGGESKSSLFAHLAEGAKDLAEKVTGLHIPLTPIEGVETVVEGLKSVGEGIKQAAETGKQLGTLSSSTGESVSSLVTLKDAFEESGAGSEALQGSLGALKTALGGTNEDGQSTGNAFAKLGLNLQQLRSQSTAQQFQQIGEALNQLPSHAERSAAAMEIFGKQGADMMALFANPAVFASSQQAMQDYGDVMERNTGISTALVNGLDHVSQQGQHLFAGMLDALGPAILPVIERMEKVDLTHLGQQIGSIGRLVVEAFDGGKLGQLLWTGLAAGSTRVFNVLTGSFAALLASVGTLLVEEIKTAFTAFTHLGDIFVIVKDGLIGAIEAAGGILLEIFKKPIAYMQAGLEVAIQKTMETMGKIPGVGKMLGLGDFKAQSWHELYAQHVKDNEDISDQAVTGASDHFGAAGGATSHYLEAQNYGQKIADVVNSAKAASQFGQLIDPTATDSALKSVVTPLLQSAAQKDQKKREELNPHASPPAHPAAKPAPPPVIKVPASVPAANAKNQQSLQSAATTPSGSPAQNQPKIQKPPEVDRLAKMGLFIGRGGPAGESHARDTARNTGSLLTEARRQTELWRHNFKSATTPHSAF
ncbi:MAG: hypothetical protein QM796_18675 [Chthoniobacteraceae bacterium]